MPKFEGTYYDEAGATCKAVVEAEHKYAARDMIRALGGITQLRQVPDSTDVTAQEAPDEAEQSGAAGSGQAAETEPSDAGGDPGDEQVEAS